jgi:replication factor C large subunit
MAAHYEMDAGDVAFVTGSGESTNKVESIVADARDLREEAAAEAAGLFDTRSAAEAEAEGGDGDDAGDDEEDATTDLDSFGDDEDGDDDPDPDDRAEAAADDDQQAGLGDFV